MNAPLCLDDEGRPTFACQEDPRDQQVFACLKYGKRNLHGRGEGHRISRCGCWPRGYYLTKADQAGGEG